MMGDHQVTLRLAPAPGSISGPSMGSSWQASTLWWAPESPVQSGMGRSGSQHILCVCFSQHNEWDPVNVILTGSKDGVVRMWSLYYVQVPDDSKVEPEGPKRPNCSPARSEPSLGRLHG